MINKINKLLLIPVAIIGCLLSPMDSKAQVSSDNFYELTDFSKLLHSQVSPFLIPENGALSARNLVANDTYGYLTKRNPMLSYGSAGSSAITGMHRFYKSDGTKVLIAASSTLLQVGDDSTGTFTTIRDQLSSGARWQFITYKDKAIMTDGIDRPQKYDGYTQTTADTDNSRTSGVLTTDLGAPFAQLNTGTTLEASKWYQYKIASYDGANYYYSSARSNPLLTGGTVHNISLSDIPLGPEGTTKRIIYRTLGASSRVNVEATSTFYKVAEISDNSTTTYDDAISDATISADNAPTWATVSAGVDATPPIAKYLTIHQARLFMANRSGSNSEVDWSETFKPDVFLASLSSYDFIRPDDGDQITGIFSFRGSIVVGKTNTISKIFTDSIDPDNWRVSDPFSFVGCPAPWSYAISPEGIIYLSKDGIYAFNGDSSSLISDVVTKDLRDFLETNFDEASGVYYDNIYQLSYTSKISGSSTNNRVLVLDLTRNAYEIDEKSINTWAVFSSGTDFGTVYGGSSTDGNIYATSASPSLFIARYKSDFSGGTVDSINVDGTDNDPFLELGWGITIDDSSLAGMTINGFSPSTAIIDRKKSPGYWYSPAIFFGANSFDKIYWNELLGAGGNITFAIRSAATSGGLSSASWSSEYTDPTGSDISGLTAHNYIQVRITFSVSDLTQTPRLYLLNNYVFKISYAREGGDSETSFLTFWDSGFRNFGVKGYQKRIKAVRVFYTGTQGTLTCRVKNLEGDIDTSFDIDLSKDPTPMDQGDPYWGTSESKVYEWLPPANSSDDPSPVGEFFDFSVSENGIVPWSIQRVVFIYDVEELN